MKRFLVVVALGATSCLAAQAASTRTTGYISDAKCGATHTASAPNADCVKGCIKSGQKPVFVDDTNKQVWSIDNPGLVKNFYGQHVTVTAKMDDTNKSVHITRVKVAQ